MKLLFIILLNFIAVITFYGQNKVTGTVKDNSGNPIYGVTVKVYGKSQAVITDMDGHYSVEASAGDVIIFDLIGIWDKEIQRTVSSGQNIVDLSVSDEITSLKEVTLVSTGYGKIDKAGFTGVATIVDEKGVEKTPSPTFQNALIGAATGVNVSLSSGQPGGAVDVSIRGVGSLNSSSQPLYVIDGVPVVTGSLSGLTGVQTNALSSINPNDIESMTVLKDASAASIYGARGANGVIVITTKQGKSGQSKINFSAEGGVSTLPWGRGYEMVNSREYFDLNFNSYLQANLNAGQNVNTAVSNAVTNSITASRRNPWNTTSPYIVNTNGDVVLDPNAKIVVDNSWKDAVFRSAVYQKYTLSASGGNGNMTYYTSLAYTGQEGISIGSNFDRISSKLNMTSKILSNLDFGMNNTLSFTNTEAPMVDGTAASPMRSAFLFPNTNNIYQIDENERLQGNLVYILDSKGNRIPEQSSILFSDQNPVAVVEQDIFQSKVYRVLSDMYLDWNVFKDETIGVLSLRPSIAVDFLTNDDTEYRNPFGGDAKGVSGRMTKDGAWNLLWRNLNSLTYSNKIAEDHNINVFLGTEAIANRYQYLSAQGTDLPAIDGVNLPHLSHSSKPVSVNSYVSEWRIFSFISKVDYSYNNKYYLSGSYRRDGSSRFGKDVKFGNFWSVGATWRIKREDFLSSYDFLDDLKLRASYGTLGNDRIGNFESLELYSGGYIYSDKPGYIMTQPNNPNLTWEKTSTLNIGVDFSILKSIIGSIEFYNKLTTDMIFSIPLSRVKGLSSATINGGSILNRGVELELNPNIIKSESLGGFNWNMNLNVAYNKNELVSIPEQFGKESYVSGSYINKVGEPIRNFYRLEWAGVAKSGDKLYNAKFQESTAKGGEPLWYIYDDKGNKYKSNQYILGDNRRVQGSAIPVVTGGFGNTFTWKGISLSVLLSYQFGGLVYDAVYQGMMHDGNSVGQNVHKDALNHYGNNSNSNIPIYQNTNVPGRLNVNSNNASTRYQFSSDFIRVRNITLGYNIPQEWLKAVKIKSLSINANLENPYAWFLDENFKGYDTQVNSNSSSGSAYGYVNYRTPAPTTFSLGVNLGL